MRSISIAWYLIHNYLHHVLLGVIVRLY